MCRLPFRVLDCARVAALRAAGTPSAGVPGSEGDASWASAMHRRCAQGPYGLPTRKGQGPRGVSIRTMRGGLPAAARAPSVFIHLTTRNPGWPGTSGSGRRRSPRARPEMLAGVATASCPHTSQSAGDGRQQGAEWPRGSREKRLRRPSPLEVRRARHPKVRRPRSPQASLCSTATRTEEEDPPNLRPCRHPTEGGGQHIGWGCRHRRHPGLWDVGGSAPDGSRQGRPTRAPRRVFRLTGDGRSVPLQPGPRQIPLLLLRGLWRSERMRAAALLWMLLAMTILHPGIALAAGLFVYLTARKPRPAVPRARLVRAAAPRPRLAPPAARFPTRAEALAHRFVRVG